MSIALEPAIWMPAIRAGTGADVFSESLAVELEKRGFRVAIPWLPKRAEYAPWTVPSPNPPSWATIVHVNTWMPPRFIPRRLPVLATLHHAVHSPAMAHYKGLVRASYHKRWIAPNERRVLHRADRVVAVSRHAAETARVALCDVPIDVIHNGVDVVRFAPGERHRATGDPFRLLYVGGWTALKGVDLLAPIMRALGDGFELRYTGGDAAQKDNADMPASMQDIGRLRGTDAVVAAMQGADALLFPSRSEGFGLVAAEAMACGLPVIATRGSSLVEVVADGVTGILCEQDDVAAFAEAARSLAVDPDRHAAMRLGARQRAVALFSVDTMVEAYIRIYRDLLSG